MQKTLIVWGEQDKVFPMELAHRLKRLIWISYIRQAFNLTQVIDPLLILIIGTDIGTKWQASTGELPISCYTQRRARSQS